MSEATSAKLEDSDQQLRMLIDGVMDYAIYMLDSRGVVATWNIGAQRLKGYEADEIVGKHVTVFFAPEDVAAGRPEVELGRAAAEGRFEQEAWRVRKDGSRFWANIVLSALRDDEGKLIGYAKVTRDISARKAAEESMRSYASRLERSNRELESFASIASHDLQEPLRKISAFGELLSSRYGAALVPEAQGYLTRMRDAAGRLSQLIENLLSYSRVTTVARPFATVDLTEVAREAASDLETRVTETQGRIVLEPLPTVEGDPIQFRQLFQNLFGNALKFHRRGVAPVVVVSSRALTPSASGEPTRCEIRVEDNGIGFEPRFAERIFGVFQRLNVRDEYEGTGIGLAICRRIVERHCGTIVAQGVPDRGATFVIVLPHTQFQNGRDAAWKALGSSS